MSDASLFPLDAVRLLQGPFYGALEADRAYILAHDPDRLLAPFRREAGLPPRAESYRDWESSGLDGHTAGHYLSALAALVASTGDPESLRRLDYMIDELAHCQDAAGDGYLGGIPDGRTLWSDVAAGRIQADGFNINRKWVPWYNLHKTFAGLRDAHVLGRRPRALALLVRYGDWCERVTGGLDDAQMQDMLRAEHGGMAEVLADLSALSGQPRFLRLAKRFQHRAILDPLIRGEDRLNGLHANTQIPKISGLQRISELEGDAVGEAGARFFWDTVTRRRSVAFGGNSVAEHFNDPADFRSMLEHREGPETCNTTNLLHLTTLLFARSPQAALADYYERALLNHLLSAINPARPGFVYFTPIRPAHYRVYSKPQEHFWCCVGTGMENPARYGTFVYARAGDGIYVNLFLASELRDPRYGLVLRQETAFPDEASTRLVLQLDKPADFTLRLRHPGWVASKDFRVRLNGAPVDVESTPSSYVAVRREWRDGDIVELDLPMRTTVERLPDGSNWHAILHGPVLLASPAGTNDLKAGEGRRAHIPMGTLEPLDSAPALIGSPADIPAHVVADPASGPLHFRIREIADPAPDDGLPLVPFFRLHDRRYQIYFDVTSREARSAEQTRLALTERAKLEREAATLDLVRIGEQQPEADHAFFGEETATGEHSGRRWRHGRVFGYTLRTGGATTAVLAVTYWGGDRGRSFDVMAGGSVAGVERLVGAEPGRFVERRYPLSPELLAGLRDGELPVRFVAHPGSLAGGVFEVRLLRANIP